MKFVIYIVVFIVIIAIRVGIRMLFSAGSNAISGHNQPQPQAAPRVCPHCGSSNTTTSGTSVYCFACNQSG